MNGSSWFAYAVVVTTTFVVGLLAFTIWVLSLVF
ncbi:hypothetical protein HNR71_003443 [Kribbella sandramycini]|uniref:Uncharacterized protein n=1 Tax=Kribbella sandramycini TaxID=60450 RepID=A0A841SIA9_9ACTN|nr:hypothetical protein [Kribbella sandramycini]